MYDSVDTLLIKRFDDRLPFACFHCFPRRWDEIGDWLRVNAGGNLEEVWTRG